MSETPYNRYDPYTNLKDTGMSDEEINDMFETMRKAIKRRNATIDNEDMGNAQRAISGAARLAAQALETFATRVLTMELERDDAFICGPPEHVQMRLDIDISEGTIRIRAANAPSDEKPALTAFTQGTLREHQH